MCIRDRIIDLGSGRRAGTDMTTGVHVTTFPYRAPEGVQGRTTYDSKVDVWSVGCISAEMISCVRLFPGPEDQMGRLHAEFSDARTVALGSGGGGAAVLFSAQTAAGAQPEELRTLAGMLEPVADLRFDATAALAAFGVPRHHERPTGPYVEPVYDVRDLRGMHKVIAREIAAFHAGVATCPPAHPAPTLPLPVVVAAPPSYASSGERRRGSDGGLVCEVVA